VLQRKNIRDLNRYLEIGRHVGVKEFRFQHLIVFSDEVEKDTLYHWQKECNEYLEKAANYSFEKGLKLELPPRFYEHQQSFPDPMQQTQFDKMPACSSPWTSLIFEPDGRITSCCSLDMITMGNIHEDSFHSIWNGEQYRMLRKSMYRGNNSQCTNNCLAIEAGDPNNPHSIFRQQLNVYS
jgi:radical SAM protein with 4Fe4S-binding SPASM domain